ncbi:MAG: flagellar export protein FliJ [Desulfotomaculales bacterium]
MEPVLKHRRAAEEQAAVALARAQRVYQQHRESLGRTEDLLRQVCAEPAPGNYDLTESLHLTLYREHLAFLRRFQEEEVKKAGAWVDECRSLTVEKRREKLLLEKLREKKYAGFREEAGRTEQKELDESGIQGFFGRGASGSRGSFWE